MSQVKSYFTDIRLHILEEIEKATSSVYIAVAWFTDFEIFNLLVQKASLGIKVEILIVDDEINANSKINFDTLFENGGKIWKIDREQNTMHNKFCIIDQNVVINGSYNWTNKASDNHENIMIVSGNEETAIDYLEEFNQIKRKYLGTLTESYLKLSKRLTVLNTLISLGDREDILKQGEKIKELSLFVNQQQYLDLKNVLTLCKASNYDDAYEIIENLIKQTSNFKENSLEDYDTVDDYSEGLAVVSVKNKYGYIDKLGKEAIPLKFDFAYMFIDNIAKIKIGNNINFINKAGQAIFDSASNVCLANWYFVKLNKKKGIVNQSGKILRDIKYIEIDINFTEFANQNEYKRIDLDNSVNYINTEGDFLFVHDLYIYNKCFYKKNFILARDKDDKDNYEIEILEDDVHLNSNYKEYRIMFYYEVLLEQWFDEIQMDLKRENLLKIKKNNKWNIIDCDNGKNIFSDWVDNITLLEFNNIQIQIDNKCNIFNLVTSTYILPEFVESIHKIKGSNYLLKTYSIQKINIVNLKKRIYVSEWVDENEFEILASRSVRIGTKWFFLDDSIQSIDKVSPYDKNHIARWEQIIIIPINYVENVFISAGDYIFQSYNNWELYSSLSDLNKNLKSYDLPYFYLPTENPFEFTGFIVKSTSEEKILIIEAIQNGIPYYYPFHSLYTAAYFGELNNAEFILSNKTEYENCRFLKRSKINFKDNSFLEALKEALKDNKWKATKAVGYVPDIDKIKSIEPLKRKTTNWRSEEFVLKRVFYRLKKV